MSQLSLSTGILGHQPYNQRKKKSVFLIINPLSVLFFWEFCSKISTSLQPRWRLVRPIWLELLSCFHPNLVTGNRSFLLHLNQLNNIFPGLIAQPTVTGILTSCKKSPSFAMNWHLGRHTLVFPPTIWMMSSLPLWFCMRYGAKARLQLA